MTALPALHPMLRWVLGSALAVALLSACTVPEWQKPGTALAEVERDMGRPSLVVPLADGGQRLIYSRQPAGQQVYHMDFDAQQRLMRVEQVLSLSHFHALQNGQDTRETVYQQFGRPALVERVARFDGDIWTYRILDNGLSRQAHVHMDPGGVVRRVMFTDELINDDDRSR